MGILGRIIQKAFGIIYVPEEVINRHEPILLHLSDTPKAIFSSVNNLINRIKPEYIIHTGDMVDNLKVEIYPSKTYQYINDVKKIVKMLEHAKEKSYITLGNHDVPEVIDSSNRIQIVESGTVIHIESLSFMVAHKYNELTQIEVDYKLFGHQPEYKLMKNELNGIDGINIILLESNRIIRLDYPIGTDDIRTGKSRIGI